jgi:glycosyltransferase involved in cell wall biosynthesis
MKILHIIVDLDVGGAETMLKRLLESDPEATNSSVVISLTSLGVFGAEFLARGIQVHALEMRWVWDFPLAFLRLVQLIRHLRPHVIQTWMYHADFMGGLAARAAGCRNVVWGIRRTSLTRKNPLLTILVMRLCALLSPWVPKSIICNAEAGRQAHISAGYDGSRIVVIPNGFDLSLFDVALDQRRALRDAMQLAEGDLVVGCVGRFDRDKGQDNFVKAAAILLRSQPHLKFLMVGRDCDPSNDLLSGWLRDAGIQDRFTLLGERSDIPVCLSTMDVFCMPSRTEGFPNGLGEAMAMGLPCVATKVGDTTVLGGDTVRIVPPEDEESLARGLLEVISMPAQLRIELGRRAKMRVMEEFSLDKAHARFRSVYEELDH